MKKLENQTVFQCSYCSKVSKSAAGIYQHERFCKKNPHNQLLCTSCAHCHREEHISEPGEKFNYSNSDVVISMRVIENNIKKIEFNIL